MMLLSLLKDVLIRIKARLVESFVFRWGCGFDEEWDTSDNDWSVLLDMCVILLECCTVNHFVSTDLFIFRKKVYILQRYLRKVYKGDEWCYCEWNWSFKNLVISSCFYWVDDYYLSLMNSYQLEFCLDNICFLKCHLIANESMNIKWWLTESSNKSLSSCLIGTVICIISFVLQ